MCCGCRRRHTATVPITRYFGGHYLRLLRGLRRVMHHRVGVFDAAAVRASLLFEQSHERVVVLAVFPIALPFQQCANRRETHCTGLHHARERGFLRGGRSRPAAIFDDINVVACAEHFDGRPSHTNLGPEYRAYGSLTYSFAFFW